jgi:hypothetical protein
LAVSDLGVAPDPASTLGHLKADIVPIDLAHEEPEALVSFHSRFGVSLDVQLQTSWVWPIVPDDSVITVVFPNTLPNVIRLG